MARNVTLGELIDDVRAEAGHSLQANLGAAMREVLIKIIQRQQRRLWEDYDWPFLRVEADVNVSAGQRYYDLPANLALERIEKIEFKWDTHWHALEYGIGAREYSQFDSDNDVRSWPLYRWKAMDDGQVEVWPIPAQDSVPANTSGTLRFSGIRNLRPLVREADRADLDDTLLVLYSAAEILAREKSADAGLKLTMAEKHYARTKGRNSKSDTFVLSKGTDQPRKPGGPSAAVIQYISPPVPGPEDITWILHANAYPYSGYYSGLLWKVQRINVDGTVSVARNENNPTIPGYTAAWDARLSLVYE